MLSTLSYSQVDSGKYTITADSFLVMMDKRNSEFINKPFAQFSIKTNNKKCSNRTLKGKVVFINFWFAACAPCMAEMDQLNRLFEHFKQYKNFEFVSFTFESPNEIALIKKKYNIHYNIFSISRDECYRLNNNNGFPTSIILNAAGYVKWIHSTDAVNEEEIKKYFAGEVYPLIVKEL
ncbi:TlpA family protein disulfide reductase [Ginsengibacter hankyongi]|nr:TlpA disulfide reductase family protein [Ginsengibacter hankyongi]